MTKKIVYKITDDINPKDVLCTTYQMRNFYAQMADGFFSGLDVMNYIQHYKAVIMMKKDWRVLDVCCGRGLLLPLIRYYARDIKEYIGVDISENNIKEQTRRSGVKKINDLSYYPFKITHIIQNVAEMADHVDGLIDFVVYTSAIEQLMKPGAQMFISCPNTYNKKDPYDTQYAAHLYEWDKKELEKELIKTGFEIKDCFGLYAKKREFDKIATQIMSDIEYKNYQRLSKYLPTPFLMSFISILFPEIASEVLFIVKKPSNQKEIF